MNKDVYFKFDKNISEIEDFKNFLTDNDCKNLTVDLSSLNTFEALKFAVLSSAYHFQKYPSGKLKLKNNSADISSLISEFSLNNMEFV